MRKATDEPPPNQAADAANNLMIPQPRRSDSFAR
jgi:hypothetical protein